MSEFSKGGVLEAEQLYRGKRKYFGFDLRSAAFKPSSGNNFRNCLIEVGDTELSLSASAQLAIIPFPLS